MGIVLKLQGEQHIVSAVGVARLLISVVKANDAFDDVSATRYRAEKTTRLATRTVFYRRRPCLHAERLNGRSE